MPYNPVETSAFLTNEQMGLPNFAEAIKQGMLASQRSAQTAVTPKALAEKLLNAHLENSKQRVLNQFLPKSEQLRLATAGLNNSILGNNLEESNYKVALLRSMFGGGQHAGQDQGRNDHSQNLYDNAGSGLPSNPTSNAPQGAEGENYTDQYGQVLPSEEAYNQAMQNAPEAPGSFNAQSKAQRMPGELDINHIRNNPLLRAAAKDALGYDIAAETVEEKEQRELNRLRQTEDIKLQSKEQAEDQKELRAAKKDLPQLQKTLSDIRTLKKIAHDKPHLFGKAFPEYSARFAKDPDVGKFQNLILGLVGNAEGKLSARGNQLALKIASQFKPSLAENAPIAEGKLASMEEELQRAIDNSKANKQATGNESDPLGLR